MDHNTLHVALSSVLCQVTQLFGNQLKDAILYGSYARGDSHEESDVDVALLLNIDRLDLSKYNKALARIMTNIMMEYDLLVNIVCIPVDEFNKYRTALPYYRNIDMEGVRFSA